MLALRYAPYWRLAGVTLLLLVLVSTLMPVGWLFNDASSTFAWIEHADKWAHAITFAALALWFAGCYRSPWRIAFGLLGFGAVIELCQLMTGYRSAEWADMGANTAGIIAGLGIAKTGLGGWCQRAENWYLARSA